MTSPQLTDLVTYEDIDDIADERSTSDSVERRRLVVFCKRAQAEIRSKVPSVDARIAAGTLDRDLVTGVAVDMVLAAIEDMEIGFRTIGDVYPENETRYAVASQARSLVRMTDDQIDKLRAAAAAEGGGAHVVPLGGP